MTIDPANVQRAVLQAAAAPDLPLINHHFARFAA